MDLTFRAAVYGVVTVLVAGCSSGSPQKRTYADAEVVDARGSEDARDGEASVSDGGADAVKPSPMAGQTSLPLYQGQATLLANGVACTSEPGATGDRWCAFTSPSANALDGVDLYVINVSRAAAGTAIVCRGATVDPNCLRLTGGFIEEGTRGAPHAAGFQGDTLLYFDRTGAGFAWRPGMSNGRFLGAGSLHGCVASQQGASVLCLRDVVPQPVATLTQSDLMVGKLPGAADPPLTRVDTVITDDLAADPTQVGFRAGFGPQGEYVAWSSRSSMSGPEVLKTQKVGDDATRVTVASNVSRWSLSPDGTRWYWLSQYNYSVTGMPSGTLQAAPFPGGGSPTTLLANVGSFVVTRTGAVVAQTGVTSFKGTMQAIVDPVTAPTAATTLDTGVLAVINVGPQGHVTYVKSFDGLIGLTDLYVKKVDGTGGLCALDRQVMNRPAVVFLPSGDGVLWERVTNLDAPIDAPFLFRLALTRLADCSTVPVAPNVSGFGASSDRAVLFHDDFDGVDGSLRVAFLTEQNAVGTAAPLLVHTRVTQFVSLAAAGGSVVFTVGANSERDGLYLYLTVPPPPTASTDAGTDGAAAAASDAG